MTHLAPHTSTELYDGELFMQQYLSSLYWSLTMLMKTAYVGPDTFPEKALSCVLVLLGAMVFAMIMGAVVGIIKAVEARGASLRGLLQQATLFATTRHVPTKLTKTFRRFVETQWIKTAGLDNADVLGRSLKLTTRFHDEVLLTVFADLIPACPMLAAASTFPGAAALPPLLRLLGLQVVLQKQLLIGDNQPCAEVYILTKGSLQVELSQASRKKLEEKQQMQQGDAAAHQRRGGGDLLGGAAAHDENMPNCTNPAQLAAAVAQAAALPSNRDKTTVARGAKTLGAIAGANGGGLAEESSFAGSPEGGSPEKPSATRARTRGAPGKGKSKFKAQLMARHIMEREGSMIGIAEPFAPRSVSRFLVTALKTTDVMVVHQGPLRAIINLLPGDDAHAISLAMEQQHNFVMESLKAKDLCVRSVEKRREDHEECATPLTALPRPMCSLPGSLACAILRTRSLKKAKRHSAGLAHASNLRELTARLDEVEMAVDMACVTAQNLRASAAPLLRAQELLRPWAAARGVDITKPPPALRKSVAVRSAQDGRDTSEGDRGGSPSSERDSSPDSKKKLRFISDDASNRSVASARSIASARTVGSIHSSSSSSADDGGMDEARFAARQKSLTRIQEERNSCDKRSSISMEGMVNSRVSHFIRDDNSRKTAHERNQERMFDDDDGFNVGGGVSHVMS